MATFRDLSPWQKKDCVNKSADYDCPNEATPIRTTKSGRVPEEYAADSTGALGWTDKATQGRWHHRADVQKLQKRLAGITQGVRVHTKHVKGHQNSGTTAGWLNNWCDRNAGQASRNGFVDDKPSGKKVRIAHLHLSDRNRPLAYWGAPKDAPVLTVELVSKGRLCLVLPNGDVEVVQQVFTTPDAIQAWAEEQAHILDRRTFEILVGRFTLKSNFSR